MLFIYLLTIHENQATFAIIMSARVTCVPVQCVMKVAFGICVCANTLSKREITDFEEEAELAWISKCDLTARDSAVEWKFAFLRQESTYVTRAGHGASTQVRNFNVILFHVTREPNLALTILFHSQIPFLTLSASIFFLTRDANQSLFYFKK